MRALALRCGFGLIFLLLNPPGSLGQTRTWLNLPGADFDNPASWTPLGTMGPGQIARFASASSTTLDVRMPAGVHEVDDLFVERGRYRFVRDTASEWILYTSRFSQFDADLHIGTSPAGAAVVELVGGEMRGDLVAIGNEPGTSATVTLTDGGLEFDERIEIGAQGGNGALVVGNGSSLFTPMTDSLAVVGANAGSGLLHVLSGGQVNVFVDFFLKSTGELRVNSGGEVRTSPLFMWGDATTIVRGQANIGQIAAGFEGDATDKWTFRVLDGGQLETFSSTLAGMVPGDTDAGWFQIRGIDNLIGPDVESRVRVRTRLTVTSAIDDFEVDALGVLAIDPDAELDVNGIVKLLPKGRIEVDADQLQLASPSALQWTGGTLELRGPYEVTTAPSTIAPLGGIVVVGAGRTLVASPVVRNGTLDVAGGRVEGGPAEVRDFGTLRVSGATGRWLGGDLDTTGAPGVGAPRIEVQSGADVSTLAARLATDSGERVNVVVEGTGTKWDATFFQLGSNGAGQATMDLLDGAALSVSGELDVNSTGTLRMRSASASVQRLTVEGSLVPAAGALGTGPITATAANQVLPMGGLRGGVDVRGTMTLSALGSTLTAQGVVVQQGGDLTATIAGGPGTHVVVRDAGSTLSTYNTVDYEIGGTATGTGKLQSLAVENGGVVTFGRNASIAPTATSGFTLNQGTVNAQQFTSGGAVVIGGSGAINARYSGPSAIIPGGALTIGDPTASTGFSTTGAISTLGHTLTLRDSNQAELGATTTLGLGATPGTLVAVNGLTLGAGETLTGFGLVDTQNSLTNAVQNGGSITGTGTATPLTFAGYVTGDGAVGNVVFNGTYSPGATTVKLDVGAIQFGPSSTLLMQLGGLTPGSQHDQLLLGRPLVAGGTLRVDEINLFAPTLGQEYDLFDGTILGQFATLDLPRLVAGQFWDASDLYATGVIRVIAGITDLHTFIAPFGAFDADRKSVV